MIIAPRVGCWFHDRFGSHAYSAIVYLVHIGKGWHIEGDLVCEGGVVPFHIHKTFLLASILFLTL